MTTRLNWTRWVLACTTLSGAACGGDGPGNAKQSQEREEATAGVGSEDVERVNTLDAEEVEDTVRRVADFQLEHPVDREPRHWSMAPLYDGLIDASLATGDPRYMAAVLRAGRRVDFILGSRTYHADGHAAGHAWLRLYLMQPREARDPVVLERFVEQFDEIADHPITEDLTFLEPPPIGRRRTDRWTWSDALYMSPPTIVTLAFATQDERYLKYMDIEYRYAYDMLYDEEAHLFYRDATYIDDLTPNGEKVFWSRGNAWVYGGLALLLDRLPTRYPNRPFYVELFQEMSAALLAAQQPDGAWYPSLLDPEHVEIPETSGTALFTLGMAWGCRAGVLDVETYWPAVEGGWGAILEAVQRDGAVESVQPFGESPEVFDTESRVPYGTGAVLMAGAEILRALGATANVSPTELFLEADAVVDEAPDLSTTCRDCRE